MNIMELASLPIPLNQTAFQHAAQFAAEQATPGKGKRVYLNTLAVCAVQTYLNWLEIDTALDEGDCWQPGLRTVLDVADLVVPGVGTLECRPVMPGETALTIPPEANQDRIGYVAVQFHEQLDAVELLGFVRGFHQNEEGVLAEPMTVPLDELLPLDSLLDALQPDLAIVNLRDWLMGLFRQDEWRSPEALITSHRTLRSGSRNTTSGSFSVPPAIDAQINSVSRAKAIEFQQLEKRVILVVQVISITTEENTLNVRLGLYPDQSSDQLPRNLQITVLDETGDVLLDSRPKSGSGWAEVQLCNCHPGDRFSVRIALGEYSKTEEFCI
ncbi:MAG: hypothetical protein Fur0046_00810 [Cyanobacteria bacterium J069]